MNNIISSKNTTTEYGKTSYGLPGVLNLTIYNSQLEANIEKLIDDDICNNSGNDAQGNNNLTSAVKRFFILNSHGVPKNIQSLACKFKIRFYELNLLKTSKKIGVEGEKTNERIKYLNKQSGELFESLKKEISLYYETVTASYKQDDACIPARTMDIIDYYKPIYEWFQTSSYDYSNATVVSK